MAIKTEEELKAQLLKGTLRAPVTREALTDLVDTIFSIDGGGASAFSQVEADAIREKINNITITEPVDLDFVNDQTEFNTFVVRDGEVIQDKIDELTFGQVLVIAPNPNTAYAGFSFSNNINNITVQGMHNWNGSSYPSVISGAVSVTGTGIRFRLQNLQVNGGITIGNGGSNFITECYFGDDSDLSTQTGLTQLWRCTFNGNITGSILGLFLECNCVLTSQLPTVVFAGSTFFVNETASYHYYNGSQWVDTGYSSWQESSKARKGEVVYGTTAERPSSPSDYYLYYDTDEGKAVIWNGSSWVDF